MVTERKSATNLPWYPFHVTFLTFKVSDSDEVRTLTVNYLNLLKDLSALRGRYADSAE